MATAQAAVGGERSASDAQSNGEILLWQSTMRLALVAGAVGALALLRALGANLASVGNLAILVALYVVVVAGVVVVVRGSGRARQWLVAAMVVADVLFLFGATFLAVPPQYYGHALVAAFIILHMTEFYFGRALAVVVLVLMIALYLFMVLVASLEGERISWVAELWSLGLFAAAGGTFVFQYGHFKRRLSRLAWLFDNVEGGDFSGTYDVSADRRPDSITLLGRAYNRVRIQLATMVLTDPLSGCLNRRGFEQQFRREIARAARHGTSLALVALDVDRFKAINDGFGHLAGDGVMRELGELLRNVARGGDLVARVGGDEFAILLPDTPAAGAFQLATRIRESVAAHRFSLRDACPITVSVGVVADRATDEGIAEDLHARADEALYAAKQAGRDRVALWSSDLRAIAVTAAHHRVTRGIRN